MKKLDYASLFTLRKDGRYMAWYTDERGRRRALYDRDPKRLYERLQEPQHDTVSFEQIAVAWERYHWPQIAPGTQMCYAPAVKRAVALFGNEPIQQVRPSDIQNHLVRLKEQGYGVKTIKTQKTVYHLIFTFAMVDDRYTGLVKYDPSAAVTIPRGVKRPVKRRAPDSEIIAKIRKEGKDKEFGLFCLLLLSTGLRRGEALALRWRDVDLDRKTISVTKALHYDGTATIGPTKTENSVREVPILPDLLVPLKNAKGAKDTYIFHGRDKAKPLTESSYKRLWLRYCQEMGFIGTDGKPTITAHVMRHGYATMLYDAGVDPYTAQKLLGHADIQTTLSIYTHLQREKEKKSIAVLENYVRERI